MVALTTAGAGGSSDVDGYDGTDDIEEVEECRMRGPKRRRKSAGTVCTDAGIAEFGDAMRETEIARMKMEERNLILEQSRLEDLAKDRDAEREQHTADREANKKNYMD